MTRLLHPWLVLSTPLAAIMSVTLLLPLSGEFIGCIVITLAAGFIIAL